MKKTHLLLSLALLATGFIRAQNVALNTFIDEHKNDKNFTFAYLSKDLYEVVTHSEIADKDWKKLQQVVSNFGSLSILAADHIDTGVSLYKDARDRIPADEFDELLTVRDGQENVRIWTKDVDNTVTDLILLVGAPEEFVLICFSGKLELGNLSDLAKLFDAEEAQQLAVNACAVSVDFQMSPNPSDGSFTLTYADEQDAPAQVSLTDQNGRQVAVTRLSGEASQHLVFSEIPSGLYWVQLITKEGKVGVKQLQVVKK